MVLQDYVLCYLFTVWVSLTEAMQAIALSGFRPWHWCSPDLLAFRLPSSLVGLFLAETRNAERQIPTSCERFFRDCTD